jgi:hypothetical protein
MSRYRRVPQRSGWVFPPTATGPVRPGSSHLRRITMKWTKPEAEVVAVTMEVTAYVATL